jgi:phosphoglycolate phosphatase-like HAD superfamily hydrolase
VYEALRMVHGIAEPAEAPLRAAGRTDPELVRLIAMHFGVSATRIDERMDDVREAACVAYARHAPDDLTSTVAPGVPELLEHCAGRPGTMLALVTGNYEPVARVKLERAGIGRFFTPGQGAFGSDAEDRTELPAIARARAGHPPRPYPRERTVVIGDTPRDVACARADGVRCFAVATGPFPAGALKEADAVAPDARALLPLVDALYA